MTAKGTEKFKTLLLETNWEIIKRETPSESALELTILLNSYVEASFPLKTRKANSNDTPWFDTNTRRKVDRKERIYKKEGKSEKFKQASKECDTAISEAKAKFFDRVIDLSLIHI